MPQRELGGPPPERVVRTARKLLALRERAGSPGEAQAAAAVLAAYVDKHRIAVSEIEEKTGSEEGVTLDEKRPLLVFRSTRPWRLALCAVLCDHYGVAWWQRTEATGRDGRGRVFERAVYLCGRPSDIELVRHFFAWLSAEAVALSRLRVKGQRRGRASFLAGFAVGLGKQLRAGRRRMEDESSRALVLRSRLSRAKDHLTNAFDLSPFPGRQMRSLQLDGPAFDAGVASGEAMHLGKRMKGGTGNGKKKKKKPDAPQTK